MCASMLPFAVPEPCANVVLPYLFRREAVQRGPDVLHVAQHEVTHDVESEGVKGKGKGEDIQEALGNEQRRWRAISSSGLALPAAPYTQDQILQYGVP